jgi:hypothetical protein
MPDPQQKQPLQDVRTGFNIFWHIVSGYATAIVPFIRKDFGTAFFGLNALVAVFVMMLFGAAVRSDDMLYYMYVWLVLVTIHRLDAFRAYRKGRIIHSRYTGDCWLAEKLSPASKRKTVQLVIEPALCLVVGAMICPYSPGVGKFVIVGAFAVMMFNGWQRAVMQGRVRKMHDAHIEQQATAQMFRGKDDDF